MRKNLVNQIVDVDARPAEMRHPARDRRRVLAIERVEVEAHRHPFGRGTRRGTGQETSQSCPVARAPRNLSRKTTQAQSRGQLELDVGKMPLCGEAGDH